MHVFITGATGWVGSAVVAELIGAGHRVTGLARSDEKAAALAAAGAAVVRATLDDHDALRAAASQADAVVHTAFDHHFSRFAESAEQDRRAIEALGGALEGSDRPLLVTSGLSGLPRGATEADVPAPGLRKSEAAARALLERSVRVVTVRLAPSVHGVGETHGFIPILIRTARATGVSAYLDEGLNNWSGVHRLDAARVFRLALESGPAERVFHAVAEKAVPFREIAAAIGRALGVPVEPRPREHFGWFAGLAGGDMAASSVRTRAVLGWAPTGPGLLTDLGEPGYYQG